MPKLLCQVIMEWVCVAGRVNVLPPGPGGRFGHRTRLRGQPRAEPSRARRQNAPSLTEPAADRRSHTGERPIRNLTRTILRKCHVPARRVTHGDSRSFTEQPAAPLTCAAAGPPVAATTFTSRGRGSQVRRSGIPRYGCGQDLRHQSDAAACPSSCAALFRDPVSRPPFLASPSVRTSDGELGELQVQLHFLVRRWN